jgi:hypothetical protein
MLLYTAAIVVQAKAALQRLYKAEPSAKSAVTGAAGYAVFSNLEVKILVAGSWQWKRIGLNTLERTL